eukprot:365190-Chlamydomonas_euryale.AAC.5
MARRRRVRPAGRCHAAPVSARWRQAASAAAAAPRKGNAHGHAKGRRGVAVPQALPSCRFFQ